MIESASEPLRIVLDANVVVSGILSPKGPPGQILRKILTRTIIPVVSKSILEAYERCLFYPKIRKKLSESDEDLRSFVLSFGLVGDIVDPAPNNDIVIEDDPADQIYVDAAIEAKAVFLVSGDRHLLNAPPIEDLKIVTPREFLNAT